MRLNLKTQNWWPSKNCRERNPNFGVPKCFETALDSYPKLLSQATPNKWQPWWNLTVPIPSTNVTFPGLWASLPRGFASIWSTWGCWTKLLAFVSDMMSGVNIPLTLCLWGSARVSDVARGACLGAHWLRMLKAFIYMQDMWCPKIQAQLSHHFCHHPASGCVGW